MRAWTDSTSKIFRACVRPCALFEALGWVERLSTVATRGALCTPCFDAQQRVEQEPSRTKRHVRGESHPPSIQSSASGTVVSPPAQHFTCPVLRRGRHRGVTVRSPPAHSLRTCLSPFAGTSVCSIGVQMGGDPSRSDEVLGTTEDASGPPVPVPRCASDIRRRQKARRRRYPE